ncbi:MAG: nucleotidyltransferase family protein [Ideonella sp.]|nr:nucleotidyltransferase family protein [Ideonella sp.]
MKTRAAVIVLAAGRGSRFAGSEHKLAQTLGTSTVLGTTLRHAVESHLPVVVVTTAPLAAIAGRHVASRDVVVLPPADGRSTEPLGMGYSIAAGVGARAHASGWLVLPGDMPMVRPATLQAVARQLADHPAAYAQHRGRRGHPVGFSAELYSELVVLTGDEGARRLLARYPATPVEVDDPGVLLDVDTEDDLRRLRAVHDAVLAVARPAAELPPAA